MKTTTTTLSIALVATIAFATLTSCEKENNTSINNPSQTQRVKREASAGIFHNQYLVDNERQ